MVTPLDELLNKMVEVGASDLHLKVGSPPVVRIDAELHPTKLPPLDPDDTVTYAESIFTSKAAESFRETNEANFAYGRREFGRFRVNVFRQRGSVGVVMRRVHHELPTFEELGLPPSLDGIRTATRGLVIVAGPSSSGKTTTIGSVIDYINRSHAVNIMTIEDPIEVVHTDVKSIVSQREIGIDTGSYATALEHVLRQDPDVILIDQMNDAETVRAALQAAEMGNLVLSSLPTADAVETVSRLVDYFPGHLQKQIRSQLAGQLLAVVCQRLLERADGHGRVPAVELLQSSEAVRDCILGHRFTELADVIESSHPEMQTYDQAILSLYGDDVISFDTASAASTDPKAFRQAATGEVEIDDEAAEHAVTPPLPPLDWDADPEPVAAEVVEPEPEPEAAVEPVAVEVVELVAPEVVAEPVDVEVVEPVVAEPVDVEVVELVAPEVVAEPVHVEVVAEPYVVAPVPAMVESVAVDRSSAHVSVPVIAGEPEPVAVEPQPEVEVVERVAVEAEPQVVEPVAVEPEPVVAESEPAVVDPVFVPAFVPEPEHVIVPVVASQPAPQPESMVPTAATLSWADSPASVPAAATPPPPPIDWPTTPVAQPVDAVRAEESSPLPPPPPLENRVSSAVEDPESSWAGPSAH